MIKPRLMIALATPALLFTLLSVGTATALPPDGTYDISHDAMLRICGLPGAGGTRSGEGHTGCAFICGVAHKICNVDCYGDNCTITISLKVHEGTGQRFPDATIATQLQNSAHSDGNPSVTVPGGIM